MVSAQDSKVTASAFSDPEIASLFSDEAEIESLILVERKLAQAQESLGIIPEGVGSEISQSLEGVTIDAEALAAAYAKDGISIPGLVGMLREKIGSPAANFLHYGATSQDVLDTSLVTRVKSALETIEANLDSLMLDLNGLAKAHKNTVMIGRTRNQNAAPIVFALKVVNWLAPLQRQKIRLNELKPRLLLVQLGGAVGTNAALASKGVLLNAALAKALGLGASDSSWHAQRDSIAELSNWLNLSASVIGKMAQDIHLMAQNEIGEVSFSGIGKSSTMPNKSNPVFTENLIALAAYCQSHNGLMQQTIGAQHERDGVAMATERLTFPSLICAAAATIVTARACLAGMQVNEQRMRVNLSANNNLIMAEAATFELAQSMPRPEASELVAQACAKSIESNTDMIDELASLTKTKLDWQKLKQPENYLGTASEIVDRVVSLEI